MIQSIRSDLLAVLRLLVLALTLWAFWVVNTKLDFIEKRSPEVKFEQWQEKIRVKLQKGFPADLKITLKVNQKDGTRDFTITSKLRDPSIKANRILGLVEEARLFVLDRKENSDFEIQLGDSSQDFEFKLSQEDLIGNLPATNLLKLFEIFSTDFTKDAKS